MIGRIPALVARLSAVLMALAALLAVAAGSASASGTVIYSNIPSPAPGNLPSVGFEATSTSEFGGEIETSGTDLAKTTVTVAMSSWACESGGATDGTCKTSPGAKFEWPVTLHVYAAGSGNSVGTQIATLTRTFKMPYRPSANNTRCAGNGGWFRGGTCFHGKLFKIRFPLRGVALPSKSIVSVAYNTENYGEAPTGVEGPYNSLNVAVNASYNSNEEAEPVSPSTGAYPLPEEVFANSTYSAMYCGNSGATGSFGPSGACWKYEQPAIAVETS